MTKIDKQYNIIEKINIAAKHTIDDFLEIKQGIKYSTKSKEIVFSDEPTLNTHKKILDGRDISKWTINWHQKVEHKYINYTNELHNPKKEKLFLSKEKILIPKKGTTISATVDCYQYYVLNTVYMCLNKNQKLDNQYIIALLNSKLLNFYYQSLYSSRQITISALKSLPVVIDIINEKLFIFLVDIIMELSKLDNRLLIFYFEKILDGLVFELYFEEHMKEKKINILEYVKQDITNVTKSFDFKSLSDKQKENLIEKLYEIWIHPDNEVRNRLKLFAVRSFDILNPILNN